MRGARLACDVIMVWAGRRHQEAPRAAAVSRDQVLNTAPTTTRSSTVLIYKQLNRNTQLNGQNKVILENWGGIWFFFVFFCFCFLGTILHVKTNKTLHEVYV